MQKKFGDSKNIIYLCTAKSEIMADQVAQLVEHIPFKDGVLGSNPSLVTRKSF